MPGLYNGPLVSTEPADSLARLVRISLEQHRLSGIREILRCIARESRSFGCVLWEAAPDSQVASVPPRGTFFALAQWFENDKVWKQDDIPVASATGHAVANHLPYYLVNDTQSDPFAYTECAFIKENNIRSACTIPLMFQDQAHGALNVYRQGEPEPYTRDDAANLQRMSNLVPRLYETVRDDVAYRLSFEVNTRLQHASKAADPAEPWIVQLKEIVPSLCKLLSLGLHCYDVSVFIEGMTTGLYELCGSTLPDPLAAGPTYITFGDTHPTAYPLSSRKPLRILDLAKSPWTEPRLVGMDPPIAQENPTYLEYITKMTRAFQPTKSATFTPALSFLAVPIVAGERLFGVLRCCVPIEGPTYFASREETLLMLLSGQIGQFVSDLRNRKELARENDAWGVVINSINALSDLAYTKLGHNTFDESSILDSSLQSITEWLPGVIFASVLIADKKGVHLRNFLTGWTTDGTAKEGFLIPTEWQQTLATSQQVIIASAGDLAKYAGTAYVKSFPTTPDRLILAAIPGPDHFGIVEIGHKDTHGFPKHASAIVGLLVKQLGLYHELASTIGKLKRAQEELRAKVESEKDHAKAQIQTFMDLEHQIKAPLRHAKTRIALTLKLAETADESIHQQLLFLRGIIRRAARVASNTGLFADLATGRPVKVNLAQLRSDELRKLLVEAVMDNQLVADDNRRHLSLHVDGQSFDGAREAVIRVDSDLLDQAINNLLDNAVKYSYSSTAIRVEVSQTKSRLVISVLNRGLLIGPDQVKEVVKRGYRSAMARVMVGEGSGIGLWIVDEVMRAHGGELQVTPTSQGMNHIRLLFPLVKG
jgi:signal transduction histidine kinase/GAF domain-containing protein